ncbi:hypothetical protein E3T55_10615 [Cryobacterium frigoriphilum]|uniref:DUF1129 family protein n=1 Tax=Cryobacterium frigoriphilum TaxID=1259150 RepID=A0A4R9A0C9_9MICO|nr:hypothetical protein [Cryobacterium frigoriphilum]TFD49870.1 hypothetical protein E3T55_10615 [Cryobacterium frigoriphilum]
MTTNIRTAANEQWLESLIIELRLQGVNGTRIGDAIASAREFLVDSGAAAEDSFGSPRQYAAELNLPVEPDARQGGPGTLVRGAIGMLGMFSVVQAVVPLVYGESLTVVAPVLAIMVVAFIAIACLPRLMPAMVRMRKRSVLVTFLLGAALGLVVTVPGVLLVVWAGDRMALSLPALPVFIVGAVCLIAPALWGQLRHSITDDPIVVPGVTPSARSARRTRLFLVAINWLLVPFTVALCGVSLLMDSFSR